MLTEEFVPINPLAYFGMRLSCQETAATAPTALPRKYLLADTSAISGDSKFAEVAMGWSREGIALDVTVARSTVKALYPRIDAGDSIELFFDTRDIKTSGFNTKFCHHFFVLPKAVDGVQAGEITRFRTDDRHPHCDGENLAVEEAAMSGRKQGYRLKIFIPSHCLVGYDPEQFDRLGFAYRINRPGGDPQHFCAASSDFVIEEQPSLWSTVRFQ